MARSWLGSWWARVFGASPSARSAEPRTRPAPAETAPEPAPAGGLELPPALEPFREAIERTMRPVVRISGTPGPTKQWESKLGGAPYLPRGAQVPRDAEGRPMRLLAQLDLAEVPDIGLLPTAGLLQFFLTASDDTYGADFEHPTRQQNYRVVFFPEVIRDAAQLDETPAPASTPDDTFPLGTEVRLSFSVDREPISLIDFRAETLLPTELRETGALVIAYEECFPPTGHKLGGYPYFTQYDPRDDGTEASRPRAAYDALLLQLDSDDAFDLMWGDVGVANFFVREEDLRRGSFADVLYSWDCC